MELNSHSNSATDYTLPSSDPIQEDSNLIQEDPNNESEEAHIYATVRYDPSLLHSRANTLSSFNRPCPFYLLEHQWSRLQVANWTSSFYRSPHAPPAHSDSPAAFFRKLLSDVREWREQHPDEGDEPLQIKLRAYVSGRKTLDIKPLPPWPPPPVSTTLFPSSFGDPEDLPDTNWTVILDSEPTEVAESTMFKTSDRLPYSNARARAGLHSLETPKEVLLYNPDGEILDGSRSTPYVYRGGRWVTPTASSGGLQGVTRRWALENRLVVESSIRKDRFVVGEPVWFSDGVHGFYHAVFVAREGVDGPADVQESLRIAREMQIR